MATRKKQLTLPEVQELIRCLLSQSESPSAEELFAFAEAINRKSKGLDEELRVAQILSI